MRFFFLFQTACYIIKPYENVVRGVYSAGEIYRREYFSMKDYMKIYQEWLSNPYFDDATKAE